MPIELPPKVKCPECEGRGYTDERDTDGRLLPIDSRICPRCNGEGEVYDFNDLARAVAEAGYTLKIHIVKSLVGLSALTIIENKGWELGSWDRAGDNPTAALLAAIQQANTNQFTPDGHEAGKE